MNRIYRIVDLVRETGLYRTKIDQLTGAKVIPQPDVTIAGKLTGYSEKRFAEAKKSIEENQLISPTAAARAVKIKYYKFLDLINDGQLPEPAVTLGRSQFFLANQMEELHEKAKKVKDIPKRNPAAQRRAAGFFSITEVGLESGVARISVEHHIHKNRIKPPKKELKGFTGKYYTSDQKDRIVAFFKARGKEKK